MGFQLKAGAESFLRAMFFAGLMSSFAFGLFHVPTPSMEPTLLGNADRAHLESCTFRAYHVDERGDQVVATKYFASIDRFDVVVFRFPLNVSQRYVKRVIGLPGEKLIMEEGELFVHDGADYRIVRKPPDLQEHLWIRLTPAYADAASYLEDWNVQGEFQVTARGIEMKPSGETRFRFHRAVYDENHHRKRVSDVRLSFDLYWTGEGEFESSIVSAYGTYTLHIRPDRTARLVAGGREVELPAGIFSTARDYRMELIHLDGSIQVRVDGREAASISFIETFGDFQKRVLAGFQIGFASRRLTSRVRNLRLDRDLHFKVREGDTNVAEGEEIAIPPDHFFVLGDNASVSKDARAWKSVRLTLRDGREILCEKDAIERLYDAEAEMRVRADQFGEEVLVLKKDLVKEEGPDIFRFVHRRYIVGKAILTFWPIGRWFRSIR